MVKGKAKGSAFERKVYKMLRAISPEVKRTLGSGSSDEPADIYQFFCYAIECKHHKSITLGELRGWWKKLCERCKNTSHKPALVVKQNFMPEMVVIWGDWQKPCIYLLSDWLEHFQDMRLEFEETVKKELPSNAQVL